MILTNCAACAAPLSHDAPTRCVSCQTRYCSRWNYARALYEDPAATLDDLRKAVSTFEDTERTARRVFGGAHPTTANIELSLREARAVLHARDTEPSGSA